MKTLEAIHLKMDLVDVLLFIFLSYPGLVDASKWLLTVPDAVTEETGKDAILPCFTTNQNDQRIKAVVWRTENIKNVIFRCRNEADQNPQNCSESLGRYSLSGNPKQNNISLRISNVKRTDIKKYFCCVELRSHGYIFCTRTGTWLNVLVPRVLEKIYIQTFASGEQFVTCDVSGSPPPTVTWILPENTSTSSVSVQRTCCSATSSVVYKPSTNYTCQISGTHGLQQQTLYSQAATEQKLQVPLSLFIVSVGISGVLFSIVVILAVRLMKGTVEPFQHRGYSAHGPVQKVEDIYANV